MADSDLDTAGVDSRRETWVKLVLLCVALVLALGYAFTLTDIRGFVGGDLLFAWPSVAISLAGLVLVGGVFVVRALRKGRGKAPQKVTDEPPRLASREEFLAILGAQIRAHARSGRQLAMHLIDIDRFGQVNRALGEAEGDRFLRSVAERLSVLVEQADRLAHVGDDEFVVLQPETGGARHAEIFARRIQETLRDVAAQMPRHARPGASIGIAVSPEHGGEPLKLLHSASFALRAAKQAGGNAVRLYAREMDLAVESHLQMEKAISDGLHHGWFELHYQPQYDLRTRRLTGLEALVRMNHPQHGMLLPHAFLPAAEESGLIQPLGDWVTREAIAAASAWPSHLTLSLNVSAAQVRHADAAASILQALAKSGVEAERLRVEIPEAVLLEDVQTVRDQLQRLKSRGVTIVLDDFGVENSSLKALVQSLCNAVKLDRTFVQRLGEEPQMEKLVRGLIGTARSFDLAVCAEGVERAEQAHFLMASGCELVQGFLFARPAPAAEVAAIIAKDTRKGLPGGVAPIPGEEAATAAA
jgi:diguanylate cyclase (GGDEF)-like protein